MPGRSIAAFLYAAFLGPLFGYVGLMAYMSWKVPPRAHHIDDMLELLFASYYVGGIPAIIVGVIMGWLVRRRSWIGLKVWVAATALIALAPPALVVAILVAMEGWSSSGMALLEILAPIWIAAILAASAGLRALMIASEVLLPPGRTDG